MTDTIDTPPDRPERVPQNSETYAVGYGRPPEWARFKKGQSGNPKGRPKGRRNVLSELRDIYLDTVSINIGGKTLKMSRICALHLKQWERGIKGVERAAGGAISSAEKMGLYNEPPVTGQDPDGNLTEEEFLSLSEQTQLELIAVYDKRSAKSQH